MFLILLLSAVALDVPLLHMASRYVTRESGVDITLVEPPLIVVAPCLAPPPVTTIPNTSVWRLTIELRKEQQ